MKKIGRLLLCIVLFGLAYADDPLNVGAIRWGGAWNSSTYYPWDNYVPRQTNEVTYNNRVYVNIDQATQGIAPDKEPKAWAAIGVVDIDLIQAITNSTTSVPSSNAVKLALESIALESIGITQVIDTSTDKAPSSNAVRLAIANIKPESVALIQTITNSITQAPSSNAVKVAIESVSNSAVKVVQTLNTSVTDAPSSNAVRLAIANIPVESIKPTQVLNNSTIDVPSNYAVSTAIANIPTGGGTGLATASIWTSKYHTVYPQTGTVATSGLTYRKFTKDDNAYKYINAAGKSYYKWDKTTPTCISILRDGVYKMTAQANFVGGANGWSGINNYALASAILIDDVSLQDARTYNTIGQTVATGNPQTDTGSGSPAYIVTEVKKGSLVCPAYGVNAATTSNNFVNGLYADFNMNIDYLGDVESPTKYGSIKIVTTESGFSENFYANESIVSLDGDVYSSNTYISSTAVTKLYESLPFGVYTIIAADVESTATRSKSQHTIVPQTITVDSESIYTANIKYTPNVKGTLSIRVDATKMAVNSPITVTIYQESTVYYVLNANSESIIRTYNYQVPYGVYSIKGSTTVGATPITIYPPTATVSSDSTYTLVIEFITNTPTPTVESALFSPYKDVGINAFWGTSNTGTMGTTVLDNTATTPSLLLSTVPSDVSTITWAFASGSCTAEAWGSFTRANILLNKPLFISANKNYIISTGGLAGAFTCDTSADLVSFVDAYYSTNMVGLDFDIENTLTTAQIASLTSGIQAVQAKYPAMRISYTVATLAGSDGSGLITGSSGEQAILAAQVAGIKFNVNLMVMDYGTASSVCVIDSTTGYCDMNLSAQQAAKNLNSKYSIPYSNIELTPMIGLNDVDTNNTSLANVSDLATWVKSNGLGGMHIWSYDRDASCNTNWAVNAVPTTCSGAIESVPFQTTSLQYQETIVGKLK